MRIVRNERYIGVRTALGKWAGPVGMLVIIATLFISFLGEVWVLPAMLLGLVVGFGAMIVNSIYLERFVGKLNHHDSLTRALKGLTDDHVLAHYTLPAPHVLLEPGGLTVFLVKTQGGEIVYRDGRWKHSQRGKFLRQWAGQESLGAPDADALHDAQRLERYLHKKLPGVEVPVRAVAIFINPDANLVLEDQPPIPVIYYKKIKEWLRGPGKLRALPAQTRHDVAEARGAPAPTAVSDGES